MTANKKNLGVWMLAGASAWLVGCATDETTAPELRAGRYLVSGVQLGNCGGPESWVDSSTSMTSIEVTADTLGGYTVNTCVDSVCAPGTPSHYALRDDRWTAEYGNAFLVDSGCFLLHVNATARVEAGELVIETTRWSNRLASGSCTIAEVSAMFERPCEERNRIVAVEELVQ